MPKRKTTEEFVEEARKVHGGKYDYSNAEYVNTDTKVCVICPIHGEFWQTPYKHTKRSQGCPKCGLEVIKRKKTKSAERFIEQATLIHKGKYDYSKVEYTSGRENVNIICPKHGVFPQTPTNHLRGAGCPKCKGGVRLSNEEFIKKAKNIHGDRYNYSMVVYQNARKKIRIICQKHGVFLQSPIDHLQGCGCAKCGIENNSIARTSTTDEFIEKARKVHGEKYDYSNVDYTNNSTKVCIICPKHGEFWQTPANHLFRKGCPKCNASKLEESIREFLVDKGIEFVHQSKFEWLDKQSLDFFLPRYNVAIECQGIQHFRPTDFANRGKKWSELEFSHILMLDEQKRKKCQEHGIRLLYYSNLGIDYPYEVYEDKDCLLEEIIKENK